MDDAARTQRRSLARVVEAALFFFGVTNEEQFEGLLDDAQQRTLLRDWLRSRHCPRDAAAVAADAMEVAQASAELQLLGRELEERVRPFFRLRSSRSSCAAPVLVLHV